MHGMDVSDYSEASDSSRIPLIFISFSISFCVRQWSDFTREASLYINFKATESDT